MAAPTLPEVKPAGNDETTTPIGSQYRNKVHSRRSAIALFAERVKFIEIAIAANQFGAGRSLMVL